MSNEATTWAYRQDLPTTQKFILVVLADFADESHSCYPGQKKIATHTGLSERAVRNGIVKLEELGYLTREERRRDDGSRTSDRYRLAVGWIKPVDNSLPARDAASHQPAPHDRVTGTSRQGHRHEVPGIEPLEEPLEEPTDAQESTQGVLVPVDNSPSFDDWWETYPRKIAKKDARRAWDRIARKRPSALARILAASRPLLAYLKAQGTAEQFIPYPATYLNGERWEDVIMWAEAYVQAHSVNGPSPAAPPKPGYVQSKSGVWSDPQTVAELDAEAEQVPLTDEERRAAAARARQAMREGRNHG